MKFQQREVKTEHVQTTAVHTVDCFARRPIKDDEGNVEVKTVRWQEDRQVGATLQTVGGGVFHRGARIA